MSRSLNRVELIGNLGKDAETSYTPGGAAVTKFSVATGRRWKDKNSGEWREETDWHLVELWRSEKLAEYLTKGTQVYVDGRLKTDEWTDKTGSKRYTTKVVAQQIILLGGGRGAKRDDMDQTRTEPMDQSRAGEPAGDNWGVPEDNDVPF